MFPSQFSSKRENLRNARGRSRSTLEGHQTLLIGVRVAYGSGEHGDERESGGVGGAGLHPLVAGQGPHQQPVRVE
jgi:hypothetical protein